MSGVGRTRRQLLPRASCLGCHRPDGALAPGSKTVFQQPEKVASVTALDQGFCTFAEFVIGEETQAPGDFFRSADLQSLAIFGGPDEVGRVIQVIKGSGVEPGSAAGEDLYLKFPAFKVRRGSRP
jgi:hypothetical protein